MCNMQCGPKNMNFSSKFDGLMQILKLSKQKIANIMEESLSCLCVDDDAEDRLLAYYEKLWVCSVDDAMKKVYI